MTVNAHHRQAAGASHTRPTASGSLASVLTLCLWEKYFQICNRDLFVKAGLTGDQKCKIQQNKIKTFD